MALVPYSFVLHPDVSDCPIFRELVAYWDAKRGDRVLPLRVDIDPTELRAHLPSLIIIECLPGLTDFRFRLIGTEVAQAHGRDGTGKTVRQLYEAADPVFCDFLLRIYREVATHGALGRAGGSMRYVSREHRCADALLLPIAGGDGSVQWILGELLFSSAVN